MVVFVVLNYIFADFNKLCSNGIIIFFRSFILEVKYNPDVYLLSCMQIYLP